MARRALRGVSHEADIQARLERASYIRIYRAQVKRDLGAAYNLHAALQAAADLIEDPPEELDAMRVIDLLRSCRQMGRVSAGKVMRAAQLPDQGQVIGRLSIDQRKRLVALLRKT